MPELPQQLNHLPKVIGLCPDPHHTGEFYMPHAGQCPYECDKALVTYVPEAEVELLRSVVMDAARCRSSEAWGMVSLSAQEALAKTGLEKPHG